MDYMKLASHGIPSLLGTEALGPATLIGARGDVVERVLKLNRVDGRIDERDGQLSNSETRVSDSRQHRRSDGGTGGGAVH